MICSAECLVRFMVKSPAQSGRMRTLIQLGPIPGVHVSAIQQLPLPLAHLDGMDGVISGDLLDRLAATDRLHGDPGLELGAVGAALAHRWEPRSGAVPRLKG